MSEYQYYEFAAIDRPLTRAEQEELRAISSRGEISATRFANVYHYGGLKADRHKLLERYFDARVYVTNFGLREFAVRLPRAAVDPKAFAAYLCPDVLELKTSTEHVLLTFTWNSDEGGDWVDDKESTGWMASLIPLRAQLLRGDLGALYVVWLHAAMNAAQWGDEDDPTEPPVPPGLRHPTAALHSLTDFFELDPDLFAAAVEASADDPSAALDTAALSKWIARRATPEKNRWLERVAAGEGARVEAEMAREFAGDQRAAAGMPTHCPPRTLGQIEARMTVIAAERTAREAADAERARKAQEKAEAAALKKRLDALAPRAAEAWRNVEALIARLNATAYDEAVALLCDLRALSQRDNDVVAFTAALRALRARHASKAALRRRLDAAKLT